MYAATEGPNMKWGALISNGGPAPLAPVCDGPDQWERRVPHTNHSTAQFIENEITPKLATAFRYLITNTAIFYVTKLFVRYQMQQYCSGHNHT